VTAPEVLTATVRIAAPPAAIFPYFTDPALMIQWIGEWADLHPEPGGTFALDFASTPVRGHYVEIDPPRRVVFTWGVAGQRLAATRLDNRGGGAYSGRSRHAR
jgi:uncharacterized protein YndB with AHSA1/START domain